MKSQEVQALVDRVLTRINKGEAPPPSIPARPRGVFKTVDEAVSAAKIAQQILVELPLDKRREMIANIRRRAAEQVHNLATLAVQETGLGRVEDKVKKNLLVIHRTPGVEILEPTAWTGDGGLTLMERAPYGIIGSITPCTNPTETILCNGIGMLAGGNAAVFNTHPSAREISAYCIDLINRAIMEVGGPENLLCCVERPTIESAGQLMHHPGVRLLVVTGGGGVVKAAMNSGKKAICAGPGNPPVVVDETADIGQAGRGIVRGASFDNNVICTDEKEVFVVDKVADQLLDVMRNSGAVQIRNHQIRRLEKLILTDGGAHVNRKWVGKNASEYLRAIDVPFQGDPRLVICEVPFEHPFVQHELLMPVIGVVRVPDVHAGIDQAIEAEHGFRHTASMYSKNLDALHRMARAVDCSIFIKNAPNYAGLGFGGEGFTSFTIASPTGEGLTTARDFTRVRRCTLAGYFRIT
ncbi:MAG: aldehyde dehydrogenase family protein [Myxococcota bacterium]|nr:aldehyde dehydrogenase family protein [Myxococcota bacterium]